LFLKKISPIKSPKHRRQPFYGANRAMHVSAKRGILYCEFANVPRSR